MDFGERVYPEYFPGHPATGVYEGYLYRFYPATGVYLGVRDGGVYVLGGPFGDTVRFVGLLTQYITPKLRPVSSGPGPCVSTAAAYQTWATPSPTLGHNAAATVAGCSGPIGSPQWVQTAGPSVSLLSSRAQTISFEPLSIGTYVFEVGFVDPTGVQRKESVSLTVASNDLPATRLTLRTSQSVRMGGTVSVRAWPTLTSFDSIQSITWTQLEGPTVSLDTRDDRLAQFTAPWVGHDTLVRLRATLRSATGATLTDDVAILVEHHEQVAVNDANALWAGEHVEGTLSADARVGAWRLRTTPTNMMGLRLQHAAWQLPFIAQQTSGGLPTVEQVMDRLVVSHDWMGRTRDLPAHGSMATSRMLNSVTAVVIGARSAPRLHARHGAIYLDASFWLTADERTPSTRPSITGGFGSALRYEPRAWQDDAAYTTGASASRAKPSVAQRGRPRDVPEPTRARSPAAVGVLSAYNRLGVEHLCPRTVPRSHPISSLSTSRFSQGHDGLVQVNYQPGGYCRTAYTPDQVAA
jgi:hypothetical protein